MQIKKFTAPTLKDATMIMKNEMGKEAIILGTRIINTPENLHTKLYEITAGLDEYGQKAADRQKIITHSNENNNSDFLAELLSMSEKIYQGKSKPKKIINDIYRKPETTEINKNKTPDDIEAKLKSIVRYLMEQEVNKPVVSSIMEQLKKYKNFLSNDNLEKYVLSCLSSLILTKGLEIKSDKKKVVAVVGPTGVGKTTTIAKLALIAKIIHKLDVGLISIDTYRLGALDQLRSFAEVSQIDFLAAYQPEEMPGLLKKLNKKDIVFIDTVGRSHKNAAQLKTNLEFLEAANPDETCLVLSSTSSNKNLLDTAKRFQSFDYNSFIITKIDEAAMLGSLVNLTSATGIPISFLTNGQVIPDDIIAADQDYISGLIYTSQTVQ